MFNKGLDMKDEWNDSDGVMVGFAILVVPVAIFWFLICLSAILNKTSLWEYFSK